MSEVQRFGVSMEEDLLEAFDRLVAAKGYASRSEAIRDMVRSAIVTEQWKGGNKVTVGALCIVYDHENHDLPHKLMHMQHERHHQVLATLHVHLDEDNCLEAIVLKGKGKILRNLADNILSMRGVKHGQLVMTSPAPTF